MPNNPTRWVEGPNGMFLIELQDDGQWSVARPFPPESNRGRDYMQDSAGSIGWKTCDEAMWVAKGHAGLIPPPDRRGLVAHSRKLHVDA